MSIWVDADGWPVPPIVLLGCLVVEILYFRGWFVFIKEERARGAAGTRPTVILDGYEVNTIAWDSWLLRGISFFVAVLLALIGDSHLVDYFSGRLFWVHMVQHLFLLVVMAPLLVAGAPLLPVWLGLPERIRTFIQAAITWRIGRPCYRLGRWLGHWLQQPAIACVVLVLGIWIWHWPPLYDLAQSNDIIHDWCEHLTFQAVSILFWIQVIPMPPVRTRLNYVERMAVVGVAVVQNLVLAVLLAFAQTPLYAPYAHLGTVAGTFSPLQDQQFGAGIMWTFGDLPFGIAFSILLHRWLVTQSDDHEEVKAGGKQSA